MKKRRNQKARRSRADQSAVLPSGGGPDVETLRDTVRMAADRPGAGLALQSAAGRMPGLRRALAAIVLLALAMFADVLFAPAPKVLSQPGTDLTAGEADGRAWLFERLRHGTVPVWCPNLYSGTPWLTELQSGTLYPVNLLLLPFSLERALNLHVWLHLCLLGVGVCLWLRAAGRHPFAGFCAGAVAMFCGPVFLHVYAGHLTNLAAMAWAPWLLLGTEMVAAGRFRRGAIIGASALALQILSGQVQYVFYTCIAIGLYTLVRLLDVPKRLQFVAVMAVLVAGALALSAAHLLPGLLALAHTARGGAGTSYEFAAMFSFPPENVVTLLAPGFFGNMTHHQYWGRCYLWEMSLFFGVAGLVLAAIGFAAAEKRVRLALGVTVGVLFVLALGAHTPLFPLLYKYAPGFSSLRGNSKFTFPCMLFALGFLGCGVDAVLRSERTRRAGIVALGTAGALGLLGLALFGSGDSGLWRALLRFVRDSHESYLQPVLYESVEFARGTAQFAARGLLVAAVTMGVAGVVLLKKLRPPVRAALLGLLALGEVFVFARTARVTFDLDQYREGTGLKAARSHLAQWPAGQRVLQVAEPNSVLFTGALNLWGYGAIPQRRYLEFMAWTQGGNPDRATQYVNFQQLDPLFAMLRLHGALAPGPDGPRMLAAPAPPMERLHLLTEYRVLPGRDAIFSRMRQPSFDPRREVLLEREPEPRPAPAIASGSATITAAADDWLEIAADLEAPAILLVTDAYAPAWRATALPGSVQAHYDLLPANYILRAVPLSAGRHRLRLECVPAGFAAGKWISAIAWIALAGLALAEALPRRKAG